MLLMIKLYNWTIDLNKKVAFRCLLHVRRVLDTWQSHFWCFWWMIWYLMCQCPIFVLRPSEVPEGEFGFLRPNQSFCHMDSITLWTLEGKQSAESGCFWRCLVSLQFGNCHVLQEKSRYKKGLKIKIPNVLFSRKHAIEEPCWVQLLMKNYLRIWRIFFHCKEPLWKVFMNVKVSSWNHRHNYPLKNKGSLASLVPWRTFNILGAFPIDKKWFIME